MGTSDIILLARWDDFRTTQWQDIIEYPEVVAQDIQRFLNY